METLRIKVDPADPDPEALQPAIEALEAGEVVAFPTETVYGLAGVGHRPETVQRLFDLKNRPESQPFAYHLGGVGELSKVLAVEELPLRVFPLMHRFWPGPLTLVFETGEDETVGVRVPAHTVAQTLLSNLSRPVVATSANPHGEAPAVDADTVMDHFDGEIPVVVDAGVAPLQESSTVVFVRRSGFDVLREGIITREMVESYLQLTVLFVCTGNTCRSPMAAAMFKRRLAEALDVPADELEEQGIQVLSAGTAAGPGGSAAEQAAAVMEERGLDLGDHESQPVTAELVDRSSFIWCMADGHARAILTWMPEARNRVFLLDPAGVPDPFGGSLEIYRQAAKQIDSRLDGPLEEVRRVFSLETAEESDQPERED